MQFDIYTDSAANIPEELVAKHDIRVIPYVITVNGEERLSYEQGTPFSETAKRYYDDMRAGAEVKTSLISAERIMEAVAPSLEAGRDALIVTISSGVSGTYAQAIEAKKQLEERFGDARLYVCDSANASMAEGLQVLRIANLRDMGESAEDCVKWQQTNAYKVNSYFTVSDLKYLRKGGRISATLAIAGTILNIKPILRADGGTPAKISFFGKERGRKKALLALAEAYKEKAVQPENYTAAICHADCEEDALALADMLRERGAKDIVIEYYDLCTGSHVGPGTVALFFYGKDRRTPAEIAESRAQGKPVARKV